MKKMSDLLIFLVQKITKSRMAQKLHKDSNNSKQRIPNIITNNNFTIQLINFTICI